MSEQEAVRMGLSRRALGELTEGEIGIARSDAVEARRWPNPLVSYSREQISGDLGAREDYAWLTQSFDLSGRRGLRAQAAERRVNAATDRTASRRLFIKAEIRHRFYTVLLFQNKFQALEEWSERMATIARTVARRAAAGDVSGYDRRRLDRERIGAQVRLRVEQADLEDARVRLAGMISEQPPSVAGWPRVAGDLHPPSPPAPVEQLVAALAMRPDLVALDQMVAAAELESRAAGRWWFPELTIGGGLKSVDLAGDRITGFLLEGSVPLPLLDRNQGQALRANSRARVARGRKALELTEAAGNVRGLWMQATRFAEAARGFREDAVGISVALVRIAEAAYEGGEHGILELLDAYRQALDAELEALDIERRARHARIELDRLTGGAAR